MISLPYHPPKFVWGFTTKKLLRKKGCIGLVHITVDLLGHLQVTPFESIRHCFRVKKIQKAITTMHQMKRNKSNYSSIIFYQQVAPCLLLWSKISHSHLSKMFSSDSHVDWLTSWDNEAIWLCIDQILFGCQFWTDCHLPVDLGHRVALMNQTVNVRYSQL